MTREDRAVCAVCGRGFEIGVAPDVSGHCERCAESALMGRIPVEDRLAVVAAGSRREVVERLRAGYHDARALVTDDRFPTAPHGHLDWILGEHGEDERDESGLSLRTSELVVLWLEDLIRELDDPLADLSANGTAGRPNQSASRRDQVARALRDATREFANEFLHSDPAVCAP